MEEEKEEELMEDHKEAEAEHISYTHIAKDIDFHFHINGIAHYVLSRISYPELYWLMALVKYSYCLTIYVSSDPLFVYENICLRLYVIYSTRIYHMFLCYISTKSPDGRNQCVDNQVRGIWILWRHYMESFLDCEHYDRC